MLWKLGRGAGDLALRHATSPVGSQKGGFHLLHGPKNVKSGLGDMSSSSSEGANDMYGGGHDGQCCVRVVCARFRAERNSVVMRRSSHVHPVGGSVFFVFFFSDPDTPCMVYIPTLGWFEGSM